MHIVVFFFHISYRNGEEKTASYPKHNTTDIQVDFVPLHDINYSILSHEAKYCAFVEEGAVNRRQGIFTSTTCGLSNVLHMRQQK